MLRTPQSQSALLFDVSPAWLQRTAEGIVTRNGVLLTDCVVRAEMGDAASVVDGGVLLDIGTAIDHLRQTLTKHVERKVETAREARCDHAEDVKERQLYVEVLLRVAVTGALVKHYQKEACLTKHSTTDVGAEEHQEGQQEQLMQLAKDRFALGLLHVFEVFQEVHSMRRGNYEKRHRNTTIGTVGWDTLLLLHFVHRIPCAAREASADVIDEATGRIVRSWRKLLQSLQTADPTEAPEHSRRRGALAVCNGLLSILFSRYNTHQCRILINSIEQSERVAVSGGDGGKFVLKPAQHMTAEVLTFYYYKGRVMLYDRQASEAHATLQQAYHLLPPPGSGNEVQQRNKQRVRFFLTVAGTISGRVPPREIMQRDDLIIYIFQPIVEAVQRGDPHGFSNAIDAYGSLLRRRGVYILLQRAKLLCFLVLVARTHAVLGECSGVDNTRIPLPVLTAMYVHIVKEGKLLSEQKNCSSPQGERKHKRQRAEDEGDQSPTITDDEMTWWTAKLISMGLVRGYISYEHKTVVLSRKNPFPTLVPTGESNN